MIPSSLSAFLCQAILPLWKWLLSEFRCEPTPKWEAHRGVQRGSAPSLYPPRVGVRELRLGHETTSTMRPSSQKEVKQWNMQFERRI
jgi:hypothetical protein